MAMVPLANVITQYMIKNILGISSIIAIIILTACKNENKSGNTSANSDSNFKSGKEKMIDPKKYNMFYELKNDTVKIDVGANSVDSLNLDFDIVVSKKSKLVHAHGLANLIRLDNDGIFELPEQSPVVDMNKNEEYTCDSSFSYRSGKIKLAFGFEEETKKRLSLIIQDDDGMDDIYTLYKKK